MTESVICFFESLFVLFFRTFVIRGISGGIKLVNIRGRTITAQDVQIGRSIWKLRDHFLHNARFTLELLRCAIELILHMRDGYQPTAV